MIARVALLLAVVGCGRLRFDPLGNVVDGGNPGGDGSGPDAFALPPCSSFGPWGTAQSVTELNTVNDDWGSQITADGLTLYYQSDSLAIGRIFVAHRPDRTSPFETPVEDTELEAGGISDPTVTEDQLEVYADIDDGDGKCVHRYTRPTTADSWSAPASEPMMCGVTKSVCPFVTANGLTMYVEDATANALAVATRATRSDTFGAVSLLANLDTGISCPGMRGDGLELFFDSGAPSDVWSDQRSAASTDFSGPGGVITAAMSASNDEDSSVTADGYELFFSSDRGGNFDIFHATRSCAD